MPGAAGQRTLRNALLCRAGVAVIGPGWFGPAAWAQTYTLKSVNIVHHDHTALLAINTHNDISGYDTKRF